MNLLTSVRRDLSYSSETVRTVCTIHGTTDGTSQVETHFLSEGTSWIRCPRNGCPFQLRHLTEISKSASWTMMESSMRSRSPVTKMEPNGWMLQIESTSTFSRRSSANGLSAIKSKVKRWGSRTGTIIGDHRRWDEPLT
jgi:hypothetical protein